MKGWQSMKRIITVLTLVAGFIVLSAVSTQPAISAPIPASIPAPIAPVQARASAMAAVSLNGCELTADFDPFFGNGMSWSTSDENAWHTPMFRAGGCRHVYLRNMGVYNGPACMVAKVKTYNENGTRRAEGPWLMMTATGQIVDGRPTIDNNRLFRVYVYACFPRRNSNHPVGVDIFAGE